MKREVMNIMVQVSMIEGFLSRLDNARTKEQCMLDMGDKIDMAVAVMPDDSFEENMTRARRSCVDINRRLGSLVEIAERLGAI